MRAKIIISRLSYISYRAVAVVLAGVLAPATATADKQLLWGDTHLHSSYSADAYLSGNFSADPDTAYRYAKGLPVIHPWHRARVSIGTPLDFLVVSDHAEFLGGIRALHRGEVERGELGLIDGLISRGAQQMFRLLLRDGYAMDIFDRMSAQPADPSTRAAELAENGTPSLPGQRGIMATAWREVARSADNHNAPGEFTALIGWEWTATPGGANLHRIVITDGDAASAGTYLPFSRDDSAYPEDLWRWLENTRATSGADFVSIPHNSNLSKGYMFPERTLRGADFTPDYLALRARWEPVVEATQIKGDSETHPRYSGADPFADFERYSFYIQAYATPYSPQPGDFVRPALKRGLAIEAAKGVNPYAFGVIGSTDSHTGLASAEEDNFHGKLARDSIPANKLRGIGNEGSASGWDMSASGLAAVWAEDNTREAIVAALRRREVYATTGPRIALRVRAGWGGLGVSVPMGATLVPPSSESAIPRLVIDAMKDPRGANIERVQVIKGWLDTDGVTHEQVVDAAVAVQGQASFSVGWQDQDFDPAQSAFYYVRVLQVPTPRHSTLDAMSLGIESPAQFPEHIRERAYSSPIWYRPPL
jgi:hypothetical protein